MLGDHNCAALEAQSDRTPCRRRGNPRIENLCAKTRDVPKQSRLYCAIKSTAHRLVMQSHSRSRNATWQGTLTFASNVLVKPHHHFPVRITPESDIPALETQLISNLAGQRLVRAPADNLARFHNAAKAASQNDVPYPDTMLAWTPPSQPLGDAKPGFFHSWPRIHTRKTP